MDKYKGGRAPSRDWSTLADDYAMIKSYAELARRYGCSADAVEKQARKQGIKTLNSSTGQRGRPTKYDWTNLEEYRKTMSSYQIARILGCKPQTVRGQIKRKELKKNAQLGES